MSLLNANRSRKRAGLALVLVMAILTMSLLSSACVLRPARPSASDTEPTTVQTSDSSETGTSSPSGSGADDTRPSGSASLEPSATESGLPSDTSPNGSSSASETPSGTQPTDTTGTGTAGSSDSPGTTAKPGTTAPWATTAPGTTTVRPATTTAAQTTTRTTTAAPTTTTAAPASGSFPVKNYGCFFRNEYGTGANIVTAPDGAVSIDVGSCPQGVVLVKVNTPPDDKRWKGIIRGPSGTYQYDLLQRGSWEGVPLQLGTGAYTLTVYEQVSGTSYTPRMAHTFNVALASSLSPYLTSSIIVSFSSSSPSTSRAASLVSGKATQVARIEAIYLWVVQNISYDRVLAASITSGTIKTYIPNPDTTMSTRKGICYDYAALMAAMLRSQGIPTRLIMGQVPQGYHAWNEVYIAGTGWVVIASFNYAQVDGSAWVMFDSTFAAGGMSSQTILNTTHTKERTY